MSTGSLRVRVCLSRFRITFSIEDFSCEWRCRVSQTIIVDLGRLLLSTDINRSWEATGKRTTLIPINLARRLLINYPRFCRQFRRLKARGFIPLLLCTWGCILPRCGSGLLQNSVYPDKKKIHLWHLNSLAATTVNSRKEYHRIESIGRAIFQTGKGCPA